VTPVNCVCGAEPLIRRSDSGVGIWCHSCGWEGPHLDTEAEAVEAWNRVMTSRPVVTIGADGCARLGRSDVIGIAAQSVGGAFANYYADNTHTSGTREHCRAWLIEKLTAAGFEVRESEGK
jgi:hypothetical protein